MKIRTAAKALVAGGICATTMLAATPADAGAHDAQIWGFWHTSPECQQVQHYVEHGLGLAIKYPCSPVEGIYRFWTEAYFTN